MKPIKLTVYLPSKIDTESTIECEDIGKIEKVQGYFFTSEQLNDYTKNVIKQALENAAEKATYYSSFEYSKERNKQSITNTFEETFKQFEV